MKKFSIFSVIFMCVMVMSLGFVKLNDKPKANSVDDFLNFKEQVVEACENDDYNIISISEENLTAETLADTLGFSKKSTVEGFAFTDKTGETVEFKNDGNYLDFRMLCSICDDYGYAVLKTSDGCEIYRKFALKRLIVIGDYSDSYGATKVISGYKDYSILCYDSEVETSRAFSLLKKENAEVLLTVTVGKEEVQKYFKQFNKSKAILIDFGNYNVKYIYTGLFSKRQIKKIMKLLNNK